MGGVADDGVWWCSIRWRFDSMYILSVALASVLSAQDTNIACDHNSKTIITIHTAFKSVTREGLVCAFHSYELLCHKKQATHATILVLHENKSSQRALMKCMHAPIP